MLIINFPLPLVWWSVLLTNLAPIVLVIFRLAPLKLGANMCRTKENKGACCLLLILTLLEILLAEAEPIEAGEPVRAPDAVLVPVPKAGPGVEAGRVFGQGGRRCRFVVARAPVQQPRTGRVHVAAGHYVGPGLDGGRGRRRGRAVRLSGVHVIGTHVLLVTAHFTSITTRPFGCWGCRYLIVLPRPPTATSSGHRGALVRRKSSRDAERKHGRFGG